MRSSQTTLTRIALFSGLRALAWVERDLYSSRGYSIVRCRLEDPRTIDWQAVAYFRPSLRRRLSVNHRLSARLFRDGFHALAVLAMTRGTNQLVGRDVSKLKRATKDIMQNAAREKARRRDSTCIPLWDGHAAERIAQIIVQRWTR